jgi:hypothetical protein
LRFYFKNRRAQETKEEKRMNEELISRTKRRRT